MKNLEHLTGSPDKFGYVEGQQLSVGEIIEENKPPPTSVTEEQFEQKKIEEVLSVASNGD